MSDQGFDDIEFEAMRYGFDGYGWMYVDNGSGGNWERRHPGAEPLYTVEALEEVEARARKEMKAEIVAKLRRMSADCLDPDPADCDAQACQTLLDIADEIEAMP